MSINGQENDIQSNNNNNIYVKNFSTYHDIDKNIIIIGSIDADHNLTSPVEVTLGLNIYNKFSNNNDTIKEHPFNKILYDNHEPIPFKFILNSSKYQLKSNSIPYIYNIKKADLSSIKINTFTLEYNETSLGPAKELYGTVKNTAPNTIKNLKIYAIVHSKNGTQVDSVKTIIPIIKSQETIDFSLIPNDSIKDFVFTYSCVGGDLEDINAYQLVHINSNKTLGYRVSGLVEINSLNYDNKTNEFNFEVDNIYPITATLSLQLIPEQKNPLSIIIDDHAYNSTITNSSGTTKMDVNIPHGEHKITVHKINN